MFELIKEIFIGLLTCVVSASNHASSKAHVFEQWKMYQPTLINLHPNEYSQEFHYYSIAVKLQRSCNTANDLSGKVCVPIKTEDLNLSVFNMITRINESKTSTKHTSCECECGFGGRECNSDQWWNNGNCRCECKKCHVSER